MRGLFVTAIGTDCGKTHVAGALLRALTDRGDAPRAVKPLMSGFAGGPDGCGGGCMGGRTGGGSGGGSGGAPGVGGGCDAGRLLAACGRPCTPEVIADICWKQFAEPLAPNVAARRAGVRLDYGEMLDFVRRRIAAPGPFLVEGAGGVMSPLTDEYTNLDLMADLGLPVLLLTWNYLGAVSHTLTALDVLQRRGLETVALVVSEPSPQAGPADAFADELARWTSAPLTVAPFARTPADDSRWAAPLASRLFG
jgi:dethiobiotin synthetase